MKIALIRYWHATTITLHVFHPVDDWRIIHHLPGAVKASRVTAGKQDVCLFAAPARSSYILLDGDLGSRWVNCQPAQKVRELLSV